MASLVLRVARTTVARPVAVLRRFKSEPAVMEAGVTPQIAVPQPAVAKVAVLEQAAPLKRSSIGQRLSAFVTGCTLASAYFLFELQEHAINSTAALEEELAAVQAENARANRDLVERLAVVEHVLASLRK
jgi:hypothetical protein